MREDTTTMRRVHLFLRQDQHRAMETLARLTKRTSAEVARDAIDLGLASMWEAASNQRWAAVEKAERMTDKEAADAFRLQQAASVFEGAGLLVRNTWFKDPGAGTSEERAMLDLREAYPRWTTEELERYRRNYEKALEEHSGVPFDEHARHTKDFRQSLRDRGVPVDDPPHPESQLIIEYDPPLARCPNGCDRAGFLHLDAPSDPEQHEKWRQDGLPGRRRCDSCSTVFVAPSVPDGRRRVSGVRLETYSEVLRRKREAGWRERDESTETR